MFQFYSKSIMILLKNLVGPVENKHIEITLHVISLLHIHDIDLCHLTMFIYFTNEGFNYVKNNKNRFDHLLI